MSKKNDKNTHPYTIGETYLVRTVTMIQVGRLERVTRHELVLSDAAWIADTGRWSDAVTDGHFAEVEPWPAGTEVIVGRGAIVDACQVPAVDLPLARK